MDHRALLAAAELNLHETWRMTPSILEGAAVEEDESLLMAASGAPLAAFNRAYVLDAEAVSADDVFARASDFFGSRGLPFSVWTRVENAESFRAAAAGAGMSEAGKAPAMVLWPVPELPPAPPDPLVEPVSEGRSVDEHVRVTAEGFGLPPEAIGPFIRGAVPSGLYFGLNGSVNGSVVAVSAAIVTGDVAGVYNVATLAQHRRKGLGEAMTWAAVRDGLHRGGRLVTLQSSEAGFSTYSRMGFRTVVEHVGFF
ncbi:MAG TPA: GNAT family N-acetyltransferase [Actinomycetota bacterium]|nr:GNAT family N-acetyltransferase [Actinomycetota bacterium]